MRLTPGTWVRECPGTSAHPRRLPMACAVGWMTTRVRLGRCSRIRRSARGGTACARTAPSGTRRGNAEFGLCWWCTGSRAWHPLAPSWVLLPTPGQVKKTGVLYLPGVWRFCSCSRCPCWRSSSPVVFLCPCRDVLLLQILDLVDMPVIVHCQVRSHCSMLSTPLSWRRGRFLCFPEFLLLQYIDKVVVVSCTGSSVGDSRVPTVAAFPGQGR